MSFSAAFLTVAKSNATYFPSARSNDLLIGTKDSNQNILIGTADVPMVKITSNNVNIGSSMLVPTIGVQNVLLGTDGSTQSSTNTSLSLSALPTYTFPSNSIPINFDYDSLQTSPQSFSRNVISGQGKVITEDFAILDNKTDILLTGVDGLFAIGFDRCSTSTQDDVENITFKCYYNKKTDTTSFQNAYTITGSSFITVSLPSFTTLRFFVENATNQSLTPFSFTTQTRVRITRLSTNG